MDRHGNGDRRGPATSSQHDKLQARARELEQEVHRMESVIPTSLAAKSVVDYCQATRDPLVPSVWGKMDDRQNPYKDKKGCTIL